MLQAAHPILLSMARQLLIWYWIVRYSVIVGDVCTLYVLMHKFELYMCINAGNAEKKRGKKTKKNFFILSV